jgi:hypothetical protein
MKTVMIRAGRAVAFDVAMVGANHRVWKSVKHPLLLIPRGLYAMSDWFIGLYVDNQLRQLHDSVYEGET